ncbi:maltose/glucose-specific PTS transporter subunit IIC [Clostridium sediminicola]
MIMKNKFMESFSEQFVGLGQRLGKSILLPISILPVAGLLLGVSAALSSGATVQAYSFLQSNILQNILSILLSVGKGVFMALPLIFAIGIAVGLAKGEKGTAGLAAVVGYFVLLTSVNAFLSITGKLAPAGEDVRLYGQVMQYGIHTLNMNVFGGIIAGIVTSFVHNKYYKTKLPEFLAFFGGSRFVPIVNTFVFIFVGFVMFLVWPQVANLIAFLGTAIQGLGLLGSFLYGLLLRTFYVFGLHHVFYLPFWTTAAGGVLEVNGVVIEGWQQIFLAQLADPNTTKFFANIGLYNSGRYFHMLFGLPAACYAMYKTIPEGPKRKATAGFIASITLTCIITGVTEPISFAFLFASPLLFVAEAILFAFSFLVASIFGITIGSTFSAGIIEFLLFGVFQGNAKTGYLWILALGIPIAILYYFVFKTLILKLNAKTPGRDEDENTDEKKLNSSYESGKASEIIEALGGLDNIVEIDNCATRLRVTVKKLEPVNKDGFKATGAYNTIVRGKNIQVIYGPKVNLIRTEVDEYIETL